MRILDLALKDLSQMFRDKRSLLFLVVMPIVFTFFMGFAYKNAGGDKNADNRIPLAVVNPEPDAVLNSALVARLEASDAIRIESMVETDAMNALHKGDVAGVLKIPAGFSEQANGGREAEAQLTLIADSTSASGQSLYQLLRVPISQLMSAVEISRETVDTVGATDKSAEQSAAFDLAWSKWTEASKISLVQVAIFGLVTSAQILVQEKKSRTLQRLITTAMKPWEIVAGHMLAMFTITFLQTAMLVVFGQWVLKVDYLREPLGVLLVSVTLGLWVASMGLLIGVIAKEEQQVILFAMI